MIEKHIIKNRNIYIVVLILLIVSLSNSNKKEFSVVPECFDDEGCHAFVPSGYCDVKSQCIQGKCYSEWVRCPEICYNLKDDNMDTLIDCKDPACFSSIYCSCFKSSYSYCYPGRCYCESGNPKWAISETKENWCECI